MSKVARNIALALWNVKAPGLEAEIEAGLIKLAKIFSDKKICELLTSCKHLNNKVLDLIRPTLEQLNLAKPLPKLIELMGVKNLELMPKIQEIFSMYVRDQNNVALVEIDAASELNNEHLGFIKSYWQKKLKKDLELKITVDPSLIAGFKMRYKDQIVDGTIKTKIEQMTSLLS
jgi:F-type H+-transporting ATPase subunit delta